MTREIDTTHYEFNTGKKPRGFGGWAFIVVDALGERVEFTPQPMKFADARRWASRKFAAAHRVAVAS